MTDAQRQFTRSMIDDDNVSGIFDAERYENSPLLDTYCTIEIRDFTITWKDSSKLIKDLQAVIDKYKI
ncbi:MAG: hypothetical protein EBR82_75800 [Caulobacteraceae bacterium]|nr:hypothetical protein [Caulobacteraceae bacterium]